MNGEFCGCLCVIRRKDGQKRLVIWKKKKKRSVRTVGRGGRGGGLHFIEHCPMRRRERARETPWMWLPAVLAGFQTGSVTLSISALQRGDNGLSAPSSCPTCNPPPPPPSRLPLSQPSPAEHQGREGEGTGQASGGE